MLGSDSCVRVDLEGSNNAWIEAFIVEHQYAIVQAGLRIHHIPTRSTDLIMVVSDIGRDEPLAMQSRQVQVIKCSHRPAHLAHFQSG